MRMYTKVLGETGLSKQIVKWACLNSRISLVKGYDVSILVWGERVKYLKLKIGCMYVCMYVCIKRGENARL